MIERLLEFGRRHGPAILIPTDDESALLVEAHAAELRDVLPLPRPARRPGRGAVRQGARWRGCARSTTSPRRGRTPSAIARTCSPSRREVTFPVAGQVDRRRADVPAHRRADADRRRRAPRSCAPTTSSRIPRCRTCSCRSTSRAARSRCGCSTATSTPTPSAGCAVTGRKLRQLPAVHRRHHARRVRAEPGRRGDDPALHEAGRLPRRPRHRLPLRRARRALQAARRQPARRRDLPPVRLHRRRGRRPRACTST